MDNEQNSENRLEELQGVIKNARQGIEAEFARSPNNWLSCFGSKVFVVETHLNSPKLQELVSSEKFQAAVIKLEQLKEKLFELQQQYPDRETMPPDEIKEELLSELDVLK